jgi:hypothetical protein
MNLSTYQPQIEDEDEVKENVVKEVVETKKVEAKKRGRSPLTEDQKEKILLKKLHQKLLKELKKD